MIPKGKAVPLKQGDFFSLANSSNNLILDYDSISRCQNPQEITSPETSTFNDNIFKGIKEKFFTFKGRLNRKPYFLRLLALTLLMIFKAGTTGYNRFGADPLAWGEN